MSNLDDRHNQPLVFHPADHPIVSYPVTPEPLPNPDKCLAKIVRILCRQDTLPHEAENAIPYRPIESLKLSSGFAQVFDGPGQIRAPLLPE
jgi:hypothetical protein